SVPPTRFECLPSPTRAKRIGAGWLCFRPCGRSRLSLELSDEVRASSASPHVVRRLAAQDSWKTRLCSPARTDWLCGRSHLSLFPRAGSFPHPWSPRSPKYPSKPTCPSSPTARAPKRAPTVKNVPYTVGDLGH